MLALLGGATIVVVSRLRVKLQQRPLIYIEKYSGNVGVAVQRDKSFGNAMHVRMFHDNSGLGTVCCNLIKGLLLYLPFLGAFAKFAKSDT